MNVILASAAMFATVIQQDPITQERQAIFAAIDGENMLSLGCRPGKAEIVIMFFPGRMYGYAAGNGFWKPSAASRFGNQAEPELDAWMFSGKSLMYKSSNSYDSVTGKARFIDMLSSNTALNIRYQAYPGESETITINYALDQTELRRFVGECGPKRVIRKLQEMGSKVAP